MKSITFLFTITSLAILFACNQSSSQNPKTKSPNESIQTVDYELQPEAELTQEERFQLRKEENRIDSLRLDLALKDALKTAQSAFKNKAFSKEYEMQTDDRNFNVKIEIEIGNLFKDNQKYLLIRRHSHYGIFLDLYKVKNDRAEALIQRRHSALSYIGDTIFDANGDGFNDFVVHWYPESGCCTRDVYNVYLNRPSKGDFTDDFEFINPHFSAKEKTIRGKCYGYSAPLYKFKWRGFNVDTIEYIYFPDSTNGNQFIRRKRDDETEKGEVIKQLPEEYKKIGYGWD